MSKNNVAGMVTLYNSEQHIIHRIGTYIQQVDKLYVVDNSEKANAELIKAIKNSYHTVQYISNEGNEGIAYALNVGASAAIRDGYEYLLMMDDDSEAPADLVAQLVAIAAKPDWGQVGIVAAQSDPKGQGTREVEALTAITSGSLLNLSAYQAVGPFIDELFIDWVDHEYCFRLREKGYCVLIANQVRLNHRLGLFLQKKLFGLVPVRWRSHSPTRLYYKFRNSLYVLNLYRRQLPYSFVVPVYYELIRDVGKVLFVEQEKRTYLKLISRGVADAAKRRLGKLVSS